MPDKSIIIKEYDLDSEIHVYEKNKKVFIGKKEVDFKDIMSCKFTDNPDNCQRKKAKRGVTACQHLVIYFFFHTFAAVVERNEDKIDNESNNRFIQEMEWGSACCY